MKKIRKYALPANLAMLAGMILSGCSAVDADDIGMTEDGRVPIEFTISGNSFAALADDPTRAEDETTYRVTFFGTNHTGNFLGTETPQWSSIIKDVSETPQMLSLSPKQYYDNSQNTTIVGFYPPAVTGSSTQPSLIYTDLSSVNNILGFKLSPDDGTVDVMASEFVTGSKTNPITTVKMKHLTSQVAFRVMAKEGEYKYVKNFSITGITMKRVSVPSNISYTGRISGTKDKDISIFTGTKTIPETAESIGIPVFINPGESLPEIEVNIGDLSVQLSVEGFSTLEAGKKYVITIIVSKTAMPSIIVVSAIGGEDDEVAWSDYDTNILNF